MNILLLQEDPDTREKVTFVLEGQFNALVTPASSVAEARLILEKRAGEFHLLVVDVEKRHRLDAEALRDDYSRVRSVTFLPQGEKPLAISAPPGHPRPLFIDRGDIIRNLLDTVGRLVRDDFIPSPHDDRDFCQIRTKLLLSVCPLEADIYIRLSAEKYVKLFRKGDDFDMSDMEKYTVKKGVEFLHMRKPDTADFIRKFQEQLSGLLDRKPKLNMEEAAAVGDSVHETVQELAATLGFTDEVQNMAKTHVALTVKAMGKNPRLNKIFEILEKGRGKYIASHSAVCGYLACAIASKMKWDSETTFQKLTLAAFLHDITLRSDALAQCSTMADAFEGGFTEEECQAFRKHPQAAADVARQFNEIPADVDIIIAQHHERADGTGFPRGLGPAYIAPLAAIFIVAHDMTRLAVKRGKAFKTSDFLEVARDRYKPSQFRKIIAAIEQL